MGSRSKIYQKVRSHFMLIVADKDSLRRCDE